VLPHQFACSEIFFIPAVTVQGLLNMQQTLVPSAFF
jgi:hypothetical protein